MSTQEPGAVVPSRRLGPDADDTDHADDAVDDVSLRPDKGQGSQTLERGLRLLALLAEHPAGLTVTAISVEMGTHRAGVYRMLRPLEAAQLVERRAGGSFTLGLGLVSLAASVHSQLQEVAASELAALAELLQCTCGLSIRHGDEAVVAIVQEPTRAHMHIAYRRGLRHPLTTAASGLAILAGNPEVAGEREEVGVARRQGYAYTHDELFPGVAGIGVPVKDAQDRAVASLSAVWLGAALSEHQVADATMQAAARVTDTLREETGRGLKLSPSLR